MFLVLDLFQIVQSCIAFITITEVRIQIKCPELQYFEKYKHIIVMLKSCKFQKVL